jgi:hypothetical protein
MVVRTGLTKPRNTDTELFGDTPVFSYVSGLVFLERYDYRSIVLGNFNGALTILT